MRSASTIVSDQFAFPAALQWKGVAELIAKGVSALPHSAVVSMIVAAVAAAAIEIARIVTKGRFPLSAVSIGLGVVLPPEATLRDVGRRDDLLGDGPQVPGAGHARATSSGSRACEPICAGLISGAALMGIGNAIVNVLI